MKPVPGFGAAAVRAAAVEKAVLGAEAKAAEAAAKAATADAAAIKNTTANAQLVLCPAPNRGATAATEARGGTYLLRDPLTGDVMRTGRTNGLLRRAGEHGRDPALKNFQFEPVHRTDVYAQQRGLEQVLHETYAPPLNKVQPISPLNPNRQRYLDAADEFLGGGNP